MITFYNQERLHRLCARGCDVPRCLHPHAAPADDGAFGLYWSLTSGNFHGIGSQVHAPLATVIVGGMLVGPVMLLLVVPALRMIFLGQDNHHPSGESK